MNSRTVAAYLPAFALLVLGLGLQFVTIANNDVAWLLTVAERLVAGARPDVDFIEFNPPASYLIYVPAVALGRLLRIRSEFALIAMMAVLIVASTVAAGTILLRASLIERRRMPLMAAGSAFAFLIFAYSSFAQREHFAAIAVLPMLAVYASRSAGNSPGRLIAALSGIGGGVAICIKPYFAFALIVPFLYVAWHRRHEVQSIWTLLFAPEHVAVGLFVFIYIAAIFTFFPTFIRSTLPIVLTVYVPVREPVLAMLRGPRFTAFVMMGAALLPLGIWNNRSPIPIVGVLAAFGFLVAMFVQGRIWFDHAYPALAMLMIATAWMMGERVEQIDRNADRRRRVMARGVVAVCVLPSIATTDASASAWYREASGLRRLAEQLRPLVPEHPRVLAISQRYALVPVARALGGAWVGTTYFQIISANADSQLAARTLDPGVRGRLLAYSRYDSHILAEDIRVRRPDVILVDGSQSFRWASSHPEISTALSRYRQLGYTDRVSVWIPSKG